MTFAKDHRQAIRAGFDDTLDAHRVLSTGISSYFGKYDRINVTYPSATQEVYTYVLSGDDIGTVTVNYNTSAKKDIVSVIFNEL